MAFDDSTSSCQSEHSSNSRTGGSIKKRTQETMKQFPPAIPTHQKKKKTNWTYSNLKHGNQKRQGSSNGLHQIVEGPVDSMFYLLEEKKQGMSVDLLKKSKWHLVLKLGGRNDKTGLAWDNRTWLLICRLKLKANYKVLKDSRTGQFEDVNAEDCRMNLNPEGCFLIEETEWKRRGEDASELKDLAKFQDKRNCKDYKECKNSVVRAGQKIDQDLRKNFFESYMDILYHKAFEAKLKAVQKKLGKSWSLSAVKNKVIEEMGDKPTNWQSKRSTAAAPSRPQRREYPLQGFHKMFPFGTPASSVTSVDLFKPPTPQLRPVGSTPCEVNMPQVPYQPSPHTNHHDISPVCPGLENRRRQTVPDGTPEHETLPATPMMQPNFIPPQNHPAMPLPHPVYSHNYAYPPQPHTPMPLPHQPAMYPGYAYSHPSMPYYPPVHYGYGYPPYTPPMHMHQVPHLAPGYPYGGYPYPVGPPLAATEPISGC